MIVRYIAYTLTWLIATIVGLFGGYHLARYCGIGESIWGTLLTITYCTDTQALMSEVANVAPDKLIKDEQDIVVGFAIDKTPTIRNGTETLSVVRVNSAELAIIKSLTTIKILAEVPVGADLLAAMTKANKKIYDRVYSRTPVDILDNAGNVIGQLTPPVLIGTFA